MYFYEVPKSTGARQLKLRVAPKKLRFVIMSACHASPFSGHSGIARTYARVATRYWWPSVKRDVDVLVRACLHCRVSKNLSHEAKEVLQELDLTVHSTSFLWISGTPAKYQTITLGIRSSSP